jgi:periplasmic protein TonB
MSSYIGTADRPDRAKAIAGVIAVHVALAVIILAGLNVHMVTAAVEQLKTFDIREPPRPPKPPPQRPAPRPQRARQAAGEPARKAEAAPIVAPAPKLPVPSPIPAAKVAGTGSAPSSGAGTAGTGTGAGGSGTGPGGGGYGEFSGYTPARLVRNLSRGDYRSITGGMMPMGSADVAIVVSARGSVSGCRLIRSSGNATVDARLCPLVEQRLSFRPALDASGRPIDFRTNFHATWSVGY